MCDRKKIAAFDRAASTEDILGQFCFALGQGAGHMRIQRQAIAALRKRYEGPIAAAEASWQSAAPVVLSLMAQVGRLAALLATQAGRSVISELDFTTARRTVESRAHARSESGAIITGPFCPPVPGELTLVVHPAAEPEELTDEYPSMYGWDSSPLTDPSHASSL